MRLTEFCLKKNKNLILDFLEEGKSLEEVMWITQKDRKTTLKFLFELEMEGLIKYENGIGYIKI